MPVSPTTLVFMIFQKLILVYNTDTIQQQTNLIWLTVIHKTAALLGATIRSHTYFAYMYCYSDGDLIVTVVVYMWAGPTKVH